MICQLCLKEKELCKKSHIIPDFMYKEIYDDKHTIYKVDFEKYGKSSKVQSGEYESNILCSDCDNNIIGKLETYGSWVLYGPKNNLPKRNEKNQHSVTFSVCRGVDYTKFKLFLLSILWRASISSNQFFEYISLGPHEETIRQMILNNDAKKDDDYPCWISTYRNNADAPIETVGQPMRQKDNKGTRYTFLLSGILFMFFISKHALPDFISEMGINIQGELRITHMTREQTSKLLGYFFQAPIYK